MDESKIAFEMGMVRNNTHRFLALLFLLLFKTNSNAEIIQNLESLSEIDKQELNQKIQSIKGNPSTLSKLDKAKDIKLDKSYIRSLLFQSEKKFLKLTKYNECHFYQLIELNLLKSSLKDPQLVLVNITFDEKSDNTLALIPKKNFLNFIYKKKCFKSKEVLMRLQQNNPKRFISEMDFAIPKTNSQCSAIKQQWMKSDSFPWICHQKKLIERGMMAHDSLKKAKENKLSISKQKILSGIKTSGQKAKSLFTSFQRNYIANLCSSIEGRDTFCPIFLSKDYWTKVISGEKPLSNLIFRCNQILKKDKINDNDLRKCQRYLNKNPESCSTLTSKRYSAHFPKPDCKKLTLALSVGENLSYKSMDCPGQVGDEGIVNIHRIIQHFSPTDLTTNNETCSNNAATDFIKMNVERDNEKSWGIEVCFTKPTSNKEICLPSLLSNNPQSDFSIGKTLGEVLYQLKGLSKKTYCKVVKRSQYRPSLLEYSSGCFVLKPDFGCTETTCPINIIYNQKKLDGIKIQGAPKYDYFSKTLARKEYAATRVLKSFLKTKTKVIENFTQIKTFLKNNSNGLIHGIGCAEIIFPYQFTQTIINQCTPLPFIVKGHKRINEQLFIKVFLAIDDAQTPRLVTWQKLFSSIKTHSLQHPLSTWTLNGIY